MTKKSPEFITKIQAEGTTTERNLEKVEVSRLASLLASKMPPEPHRQIYVGNLLRQALQGTLDRNVFKEFIKQTNSYLELEQVAPRIKLTIRRR